MAVPSAAYAAEDDSSGFDPLGAIANALGLSDDGVETYAVEGANTVVDPDTTNAWNTIATSSNSTENIGRIWTDKSVFSDDYDFEGTLGGTSVVKGDDSDFLVGLSAISSTSNLKSVVTNITPLDIVLVLDVSGSMDDPIGEIETTTYQEVYDGRYSGLDTWRTYYVRSGNDYIAVTWEGNYYNGSWQDREGNEYEPRTSRNDNNRNHVQFYQQITASESAGSKMQALKDAANGFAETFATMNDSIADPNDRHRISIVKFASNENDSVGNGTYWDDYYEYRPNYTQVVSDLDSYTTENVSALTNTINSLEGEGATQANYGFHQAQRVFEGDGSLTGARPDAQKVVIFFTDGNPTNYQNFSNSIAGQAINYAYNMKQAGALVYTIGVFEDANPSDTNSNFNRYMNAVSSNYPEAQCTNRWGDQTNDFGELNLGDRAEGEDGEEAPQYYYSATNAVGLEQVFKDIIESFPINQGSGSPIEEVEGAAGTPGYLTFTDTLGSFMEVTGVGADNNKMYLAFADGLHEGTTNDGGNTWTFSGVVNEGNGVNTAYPEGADLSEIKVTVTKSDDLETGDTITVQIPASLIPMRNYDVDTDNATMTVSDTYPVRLFYGVSVKDAAIDALNNPQNANHDAVLAQTSADGKTIDFYSNSFVKDVAEGSTEASFTPSDGNKFYYYPVNTQLFIDKNCTQPATRSNIGNYSTLYYQDSYWKLTGNGNVAEEVPANGSITRSGNDWNVTYQGNNAYIAANTPRADRPATLVSNKTDNTTGTASTVLTPTWNGASVSQKLGNNGKLSVDAPGDLRIDKNVDWGNASDETKQNQNSFKFTVRLYTVAEDGTQTNLTNQYDYAVYATGETPVSTGTISDNGEITLADGQYVVISDLPNGAQYTVTEQAANQNGFSTTDNSTGENAKTDDGIVKGTIVGGDQQAASFTNTYHATEVTLEGANQLVKVKKNLTGREWQDTDEFRFTMKAEGTAPAPESTDAVVVDDEDAGTDYTVNLSNITFENPGTFTYVIEEDNDTNPIAGIDYSNETYAVTITVVDNGTGALQIDSVQFMQRADVDGNEPAEQPEFTNNTVVFTNNYDATEATTNLNGDKDYTDNSGANPNAAGKFTFELKAIGGYATESGSADNPTIDAADVPMPAGADADTHTITIGNNGTNPDGFAFQTIRYNGTHLNNTYIYEIREVIPEDATRNENGTWSLNGMIYDGTVHTVTVEITDEPNKQGEGMHIVATPSMRPAEVKFTNVYDPTDYTLEGDEAIHGTKVLQGREIGDDETFYFELKQTDGPETVLADPEVKTVTKDSGMDFAFSELTFSKAGTYTFTVNEVADDQGTETTNGKGMTYSQNVAKVTIKVKDGGNGALVLDGPVVYENQGSDETSKAVFTNAYEAELKYGAEGVGGINVTKQLLDRPMSAGEFNFTITGEGDAAGLTADADKNFQNTGAAADQTITMAKLQSLTFDETDAGKTYTFIVDETEPAEGQGLAGVTYDKSQYKVEIEVVDNGDGSMHAVTTVTQTMDKDGNEIADGGKVVVNHANSDDVGYAVPTFGFVNDYNPNPVDMGGDADNALQVTKKVTGAPSAADYTFTLTAQNTAEGPIANIGGLTEGKLTVSTNGVINQDATDNTDDDTQTVSFGKLTFSKPGTYTFKVQENQPDADDGWTFDDANGDGATDEHTVTVVVSDLNEDNEYDGALHIQSVTPQGPTVITNSYKADPVIVGGEDAEEQITVQKSVTGADSNAEFTFKMEPVIDDDHSEQWWKDRVQGVDGFSPELTISNVTQEQAVTDSFAGIQFNAVGEYKFNVTEDGAADFNAGADRKGWTYDEHTAVVTVKVTDEGNDGQLDAEVVYDNSSTTIEADKSAQAAAFTNKYVPAEVTTGDDAKTGIQVTKKVTGHDAIEAFTFSLTLKDGQNGDAVYEGAGENKTKFDGMEVTSAGDIKAGATDTKTFDDITFTAEGDYTFVIDETTEKTDEGWTYDTTTKEVTVHVKDDGEGNLYIESIDNNAPEFENEYQLTPGKFRAAYFKLQGNKVLDGRNWEAGDEFTFTLTAGEGENVDGTKMAEGEVAATMPAKTTDTIKPMEDDSKVTDNTAQFTFTSDRVPGGSTVEEDTFTYSKPGTYRYLIRETNPNVAVAGSGILGVSYDQTVYRLTVVVTDKGDGTLDAKGTYTKQEANGEWTELGGSDQITFTNTYSSDKVNITFNAFKVLEGRETAMKDNEFTFHMEFAGWKANDDQSDNWSMDGEVAEKAPAAADDKGNIIRGDVTFNGMDFTADQVGYTYRYAITEVNGGQTIEGVTIDDSTHYVTAKVTSVQQENEDGTFTEHVRVETSGEAEYDETNQTAPTTGAIFKNTYDPGETTVDTGNADFDLTKVLKGKDWNGDKFTFEISPVSAMNDGQEIVAADSPDFPMPAETSLTVDAATGEDKDGNDQAVFSFGNIKYDQEGVYTYKVKEVPPAEGEEGYNAGITYSNNEATVVVTVTDNNAGGYTTAVNISGNEFVNEYHAGADYNAQGAGGLDITKKLNNRNMTAGQFTFTIEATGDNAADAAKKLNIADGATVEVKNAAGNAGEAVSVVGNPFETMSFDETDNGVTYTYTIKEEGKSGEGDYAGYTLDGTTYNVSIKATDKGDGTMTVTTDVNGTEYTDTRATAAFVNTYDAGDVTVGAQGDAQIVAHKTLKNDDIANYDGAFKFQVTSGNVVVAKGTNDANGNITFGDITYTTENLAAAATAEGSDTVGKASLDTRGEADVYTFNYSVSEIKTSLPGGVTYGDGDTNVTVKVTDDRHGELSVEVSYTGDATSVEFVNTYGAGEDGTAELNLKGNKEIVPGEGLTEAPALVDDTYTFEITGNPASDGTPAPMPQTTTAKNKSGAVEFGTITFTMENVFGGTASTTTDESEATQETETVEEATTTKETEVTEGAESEETTTEESADSATAENGEKSVVDESATDESLTDEATADESSKSAKSEKAATAGVTSSDEDVSTQTAGRTKTFTYTIKETDGSVPGVDNDTTVKTVTVTVTDEGNGKISVSKKEADGADKGNDFTFINVYNVDPKESSLTGDGGFTITKTLTGRDMAQGEFSFRLQSVDDDSDFWTAPTNPAAADGEAAEITFGDMTFEKPGTYTYTLEEEQGKLGGVEYDTNKYTVIATVTDKDADGNYTGELEVTWQINGAADNTVAFKNTYTAQPATVSLGAGKLMKGRDLSAGEYTFKLSDTNGNEVSTATNEENGAVTFDTITYDQAGEYTYTIIEVTPEDTDPNTEGIQNNGVTYDQTVYNATVKVTDNAKGQLVPTISYGTEDGGAPVFTNTYTAPAEPEQGGEGDGDGGLFGMAKTGDFTGGIMAVLAAVVAAAAAGATYAIRKMRRPRGRHAR